MATATLASDFKGTLTVVLSEERKLESLQDKIAYEFHCGIFENGEKLEEMVRNQFSKMSRIIDLFEKMWKVDFDSMRYPA